LREVRHGTPPSFRSTPGASLLALLTALALLAASAASAAGSGQGTPDSLLPAIQRQVMCVTCKIPLNVAESPQADRERAFIAELIAEGENEAQIKRTLVSQYGPAVLALPSAHGFDLAAYLVPVAAVAGLLLVLVLLLPRWRRRAAAQAAGSRVPSPLSPGDAARLDADLARFD
jgi:cytochrome c-type biogenesis protein CcmH